MQDPTCVDGRVIVAVADEVVVSAGGQRTCDLGIVVHGDPDAVDHQLSKLAVKPNAGVLRGDLADQARVAVVVSPDDVERSAMGSLGQTLDDEG